MGDAFRANLTMTQSELDACRPVSGEGGKAFRAFCPFHESDHQRSLRVSKDTGRFVCFACGAWGYMAEQRQAPSLGSRQAAWRTVRPSPEGRQPRGAVGRDSGPSDPSCEASSPASIPSAVASFLDGLPDLFDQYRAALPGSLGERYLGWRGIPLELARSLGVGYAAHGLWAHRTSEGRPVRQWRHGRLVFPHSDAEGRLVNFYGRAVGADGVPKGLRHDHLPGAKGYFNGMVLASGEGPVYVCEGPFDALSLMAAGVPRAVAIFGVSGWRWEWFGEVRELVFAFDADEAGNQWRDLAREAVLRGKAVSFVPPSALGGCKDVNEAWVRGCLQL